MRAGRPTPAHASEHTRDDLERISGIGPAIARRLESAGISTYERLAECTPDALSGLLAGIGGTSAGRIAESDWIGQARRLTTQRATGTPPTQMLPPAPSAAPAEPTEPTSRGSGLVRVSRLGSADPRSRRGVARSDEPTFVGIELVANRAPASAPAPILDYTADVAARRLDGSGEIPVTRLHGAVHAGQSIAHAGSGPSLPPGLYRLVAIVRAVAAGDASTDASAGSEAVSGEIVAVTDASRPDGKRAENAEAAAQLQAGEKLLAGGVISETEFAEMQSTWRQDGP